MIGIMSKHNMKIAIILSDATVPNSVSNLLCVIINVANPDAVVVFVIKVALPTFVTVSYTHLTLPTIE